MSIHNSFQVAIPGYLAFFSLAVVAAQLVFDYEKRVGPATVRTGDAGNGVDYPFNLTLNNYKTRKAYQILRLLGCISLLILAIIPNSRQKCALQDESIAIANLGPVLSLFSNVSLSPLWIL